MNNPDTAIQCQECAGCFYPDFWTREAWFCPDRNTKPPKLMRHYRLVADRCIPGSFATSIFLYIGMNKS